MHTEVSYRHDWSGGCLVNYQSPLNDFSNFIERQLGSTLQIEK